MNSHVLLCTHSHLDQKGEMEEVLHSLSEGVGVHKEPEVVDFFLWRAANGCLEVLEKMLHISRGDLLAVPHLLDLVGANSLASSGSFLSRLSLHLLPRNNLKGSIPGGKKGGEERGGEKG